VFDFLINADCCLVRHEVSDLTARVVQRREKRMKHIILFPGVVCAAASSVFFYAATVVASEAHWATQVCTAVGDLFHRPLSFAVAAAAFASLWHMIALAAVFVE
jgi:hypothetical protein